MRRAAVLAGCASVVIVLQSGAAMAEACRLLNYGTLPVEMVDERATTQIKINGHDTRLMLDSGAFFSLMSEATARELKLKVVRAPSELTPSNPGWRLNGKATVAGVGGSTEVQSAVIDNLGLLGATIHNVMFLVGGSDETMPMIGANLLDSVDLDIDLAQGKLSLMKPSGCTNASLAYWAKDGAYQLASLNPNDDDRKSYVNVLINGHPVRALLDTGATVTLLARRAARQAGVDLTSSKVKAAGSTSGIGAKSYHTWIVPIDKFSVGTETVEHSQMLVLDGEITEGEDAPDMLLGVDFILAHHMFIANSQGKIYFTYNGGRMFSLATAGSGAAAARPGDGAGNPKTPADYALRGQARATRGEYATAIADLDAAIGLEPGNVGYYRARATAKARSGQADAALGDLNQALILDPANVEILLLRAELLVARKDYAGARVDITAARKLAPEGSGTALSIAHFELIIDQPGEALPIYDSWISLHSSDSELGEVLNARCWARGLAGKLLDGALADCRKAIRLDSAKADYLDSLGLVLLRQGKFDEAIATYTQALAAQPKQAWSLFGRGLAEQRSGKTEPGKADLESARAILPEIDAKAAKFGLSAA